MALDSFNVAIANHAASRMRQRRINRPVVFEVLQKGVLLTAPEPDIKHGGLNCRMVRYVAGMNVAVG